MHGIYLMCRHAKSQIPNPKSQRNPNGQIPSHATGFVVGDGPLIGGWELGVRWDLGFGVWELLRSLNPQGRSEAERVHACSMTARGRPEYPSVRATRATHRFHPARRIRLRAA